MNGGGQAFHGSTPPISTSVRPHLARRFLLAGLTATPYWHSLLPTNSTCSQTRSLRIMSLDNHRLNYSASLAIWNQGVGPHLRVQLSTTGDNSTRVCKALGFLAPFWNFSPPWFDLTPLVWYVHTPGKGIVTLPSLLVCLGCVGNGRVFSCL